MFSLVYRASGQFSAPLSSDQAIRLSVHGSHLERMPFCPRRQFVHRLGFRLEGSKAQPNQNPQFSIGGLNFPKLADKAIERTIES